jgi:hypothetical protein
MRNGIFVIAREAKQSTPSFTPSLASLSTSSVIDLHPQSATVNFIAAKTRIAVTSGNGTSTGIDQIVASNPSAVALRQPFRDFAKAVISQNFDALLTAGVRILAFQAKVIVELEEDQLRMRLTDAALTLRRDEIVNLLELVSDIP